MQLDRPVVRLNGERIYHGLTGYGNLSGYLALYHSTYGRFVFSGVPFDGATQVAEVSGATIRVATSALNLALIAKTTVLRDGDRTLWFRHDPNYIPSPPSNRAQDATRQALQYEGVDPDLAHDRAGILTGSDISELNRTPAMGTPVSEPVQVNITGDAFYVDGQRVAENELRNTIRTVMGNRRSIMLRASIDASVQQFATVATIAQELHLRVLIATEDGGFRPTSLRNVLGSFQPTSLQTLLGRIGD